MREAENKVMPFVSPTESKAKLQRTESNEDIHVGPHTQLTGAFSTLGMLIIDGGVTSADASADRLVVSHIGSFEGTAEVTRAEISGVFDGKLTATDEVIVRPTARISGAIKCQRLVVHRGARIESTVFCVPDDALTPKFTGSEGVARAPLKRIAEAGRQLERRAFLMGIGTVLSLLGVAVLLAGIVVVVR